MLPIYTIGYEGSSPEEFFHVLARAEVRFLIDIREVPQSRRKGFSKRQLMTLVESAGMRYVHIGQLGDPKHGRDAAKAGRYEEFRSIFSAHLELPQSQVALEEVIALAKESTIALLCYERDPKRCHRSIVASKLASKHAFRIQHLGPQPIVVEETRAGRVGTGGVNRASI